MTTEYEIICEKCEGDMIDYVQPPKIEYQKIGMAEYIRQAKGPHISYDVYYYTHHKLVCTKCGHIEEYCV